jgi:hypothetical protein
VGAPIASRVLELVTVHYMSKINNDLSDAKIKIIFLARLHKFIKSKYREINLKFEPNGVIEAFKTFYSKNDQLDVDKRLTRHLFQLMLRTEKLFFDKEQLHSAIKTVSHKDPYLVSMYLEECLKTETLYCENSLNVLRHRFFVDNGDRLRNLYEEDPKLTIQKLGEAAGDSLECKDFIVALFTNKIN